MTRPKTLVLHIGAEKTGSKSIQHSMWRSATHLMNRYKVLFPVRRPLFLRNAHYPILSPFMDARELDFVAADRRLTVATLRAALAELRQERSAETIVLSAEHLSSRFGRPRIAALLATVRSALPEHDIRVVYTVRSQSTQYYAALSTHLKSLGIRFLPTENVFAADRFFNHFRVASDWADAVGRRNVVVKNYHSRDAPSAFYEVLGIDAKDPGIRRQPRRNPSLSREQARILTAVNDAFGMPDFADEALIAIRRQVQHSLILYLDLALAKRTPLSSLLTSAEVAHFRREFADTNAELQRTFGLDFDLNDHMDAGMAAHAEPAAEEDADFRRELAYWTEAAGSGPMTPAMARRTARRMRTRLAGKIIWCALSGRLRR